MTMILVTLLQPKGRIAEQAYVNTAEKQFIVKIYTQYKIYIQYKKMKRKNINHQCNCTVHLPQFSNYRPLSRKRYQTGPQLL